MRNRLINIFLAASALFACGLLRAETVEDIIITPGGQPTSGTISITWPSFITAGGGPVFAGRIVKQVGADGLFSVSLAPNDTSIPSGTSYRVEVGIGGVRTVENWVVPTSTNTLSIAQVRVTTPPSQSFIVNLSQISTLGSSAGSCIVSDGTSLSWAPCGAGGASSLGQLDDVTLTAPAVGQGFMFNGTAWVNRALAAADIASGIFADARIPSLAASKITSGIFSAARLGSGTAGSTVFLRGDNVWATVPAGSTTLVDLTDTNIVSPQLGNVIRFDGTAWTNVNLVAADITSGTFADARIASSNVTQHQAAINVTAAQVVSGILATARLGTGTADSTTFLRGDGAWAVPPASGGSGDVVGPASATDNALTRYDGTTGKLIQNSLGTIDDLGNLTVPGSVTADSFDVSATGPAIFGGNQLPAATGLAAPAAGEYSLSVLDTGALATRMSGQVQRIYPSTTEVLAIPGATGLIAHTGAGATVSRSIAVGTALSIVNGDAVAGNPTVSVASPSGNGTSLVTTAGAQTSGDCVSIDANGNHVAAGAPCGSGGGGSGGTWDFIRLGVRTAGTFSGDSQGWWVGNMGVAEAALIFLSTSDASDRSMQLALRRFVGTDVDPSSVVAATSFIPPDWDGGAIRIILKGRLAGPVSADTVVFRVHAACTAGNPVSLDLWTAGQQISQTTSFTALNVTIVYDQSFTPATMGCVAGDELFLGVIRDHLNAADTDTDAVDLTFMGVRYGL